MRISSGLRAAAVAVAALAIACASFRDLPHTVALGVVNRWSEPSAAAGRLLLAKYGIPDDVTPNRLTWNDKGQWKRITVSNHSPVYRSPSDMAAIEETVDYHLTPAQAADLLAFSDSLTVDLRHDELSSRADRESSNFLNLNLADEVARGGKTPWQAADDARRILQITAAGKSSPYTEKLLFKPAAAP